jgi:DNA topoisomerase-2
MCKIGNKMRFILAVVAGELRVSGRRKADVEADLEAAGFDRLAPTRKAKPCMDRVNV